MLFIGAIAGVFYFFKGPLYYFIRNQWPDSEIEFTQMGTEETTKSAPASQSTPETKIQNTEQKQPNSATQSVLNNAFLLYQTGDYEGAVKLLRLEFKTRPENLELQKNLGAALYSLALMRIQMHNYADAETLLDEATKIGFTDAQQLLAKVKLKQGERHRLIGMNGWGVVAEIWQHTDPASPSDEDDIVRLQDDFGR